MSSGEELSQVKLRLKSGKVVSAADAFVKWQQLKKVMREFPTHFFVCTEMWKGKLTDVPDYVLEDVMRAFRGVAFDQDGEIKGVVDVAQSSYRVTPDGPMLVNPFDLITDEDRRNYEAIERHFRRRRGRGDDFPPSDHAR